MTLRVRLLAPEGVVTTTLDLALATSLVSLPEGADLYFEPRPGAFLVPVRDLVCGRVRPGGVASANRLMAEAAAGRVPRRTPISVEPHGDGLWLVLDGNSTAVNAIASGWGAIPGLRPARA